MSQRQLALELWLAAKAKSIDRMDIRPKEMMMSESYPQNALVLADMLVGESTKQSDFGRTSRDATGQPWANPTKGLSSGPGAKVARVADNAETVEQIRRFEAFSSRSILAKSCDLSLKCVAAGIRCWAIFRDLRRRPHFPPTEEAAFSWLAYSPEG